MPAAIAIRVQMENNADYRLFGCASRLEGRGGGVLSPFFATAIDCDFSIESLFNVIKNKPYPIFFSLP